MSNSNGRELIMGSSSKEISAGSSLNVSLLNTMLFWQSSVCFSAARLLKMEYLQYQTSRGGILLATKPMKLNVQGRSFGLLFIMLFFFFFFCSIRMSHHNLFHTDVLMRKSPTLHVLKMKTALKTRGGGDELKWVTGTHTDVRNLCVSMSGLVTGWQFN